MQLLLGSLNNDDLNSSENVAQKVDLGCSNFIAIIPTLLFCQILAIFSGVDFERNVY